MSLSTRTATCSFCRTSVQGALRPYVLACCTPIGIGHQRLTALFWVSRLMLRVPLCLLLGYCRKLASRTLCVRQLADFPPVLADASRSYSPHARTPWLPREASTPHSGICPRTTGGGTPTTPSKALTGWVTRWVAVQMVALGYDLHMSYHGQGSTQLHVGGLCCHHHVMWQVTVCKSQFAAAGALLSGQGLKTEPTPL